MDLNWLAKVLSVLNDNQKWFMLISLTLGFLGYFLYIRPNQTKKTASNKQYIKPITIEQHALEIATSTKNELKEVRTILDTTINSLDLILEKIDSHEQNSIRNSDKLQNIENDVQMVRDKINELIGRQT